MKLPSNMKLADAPTPLQKIIADVTREFKKRGRAKARVRAVTEKEITSRDVSALMNPADKYMIEGLLKARAREGALAVAVVSEIWTIESHKMGVDPFYSELAVEIAREGLLHRHPDRVEKLMVTYETAEWGILATAEIKRKPDRLGYWALNRVPYDRPPNRDEIGCSGRFTRIYEKARR